MLVSKTGAHFPSVLVVQPWEKEGERVGEALLIGPARWRRVPCSQATLSVDDGNYYTF